MNKSKQFRMPPCARIHFPLSVGPADATVDAATLAIVTHVDVIPPQRENGTAIVKQLADDSRKDNGNLRFDVVTQVNRQNHFTLIEMWRDSRSAEAHGMAAHTRTFRERLGLQAVLSMTSAFTASSIDHD
jgi:quinol monooxygenase YgiN